MAAMNQPDPSSTRDQLILAAGKLFSEQGFDSASTRAIAEACGANLAAIHYHFGSKQALYQAVLETVCRHHASVFLAQDDPASRPGVLDTPAGAAHAIRARVRLLFAMLIGPAAIPWQAQLIFREMTQPSSQHNLIVEHLAAPMHARWLAIHRHVRPHASEAEAQVWALHLPAMLRLLMTARPTMQLIMGTKRLDDAFFAEAVRQTADAMILLLHLPLPEEGAP